MTTKELEAELRRRKTKHNIKVGPMVVALDFDEMRAVQEQIAPFLGPPPANDIFGGLLNPRNQITYP